MRKPVAKKFNLLTNSDVFILWHLTPRFFYLIIAAVKRHVWYQYHRSSRSRRIDGIALSYLPEC